MIETVWFVLVALMIVMYVLLDGFDLGAGAVHMLVARSDEERQLVLRSIGPVWDGNEVWLLAAGGTLYFAFPRLYATAFSGFYLPLIIVLWLLMGRGVSLELRSHLDSPVWRKAWDVIFSISSALLIVFYGAALGNVVRGVPIDESGRFFSPLWTDLTLGPDRGIIDWFTLTVGVAALFALLTHGALWVAYKTEGDVRRRARAVARRTWFGTVITAIVLVGLGILVQPQLTASMRERPWLAVFWLLIPVGLAGMWHFMTAGEGLTAERALRADRSAFLCSGVFIVGMLASAAFGLYPMVLPAGPDVARSLTVENAAAARYGLRVGLAWWIPGMALVTAYFIYTYRRFAGKVSLEGGGY